MYQVKNSFFPNQVTPSPLRFRQCCRNGCLNVCLSTTSVHLKAKEYCSQNCLLKGSRRNTVENFELLPAFMAGAGALSTGGAFFLAKVASNQS
jgi:hypothetical protein